MDAVRKKSAEVPALGQEGETDKTQKGKIRMKHKFIVPRHNWVYGKDYCETALRVGEEVIKRAEEANSIRKTRGEPPKRIPRKGMMCVMGHVCSQIGIPKRLLDSRGCIEEIPVGQLSSEVARDLEQLEQDGFDSQAYETNDAADSREEIEQALIALFAAHGYELEFVQ
jgi:hypothetical protein